jgi:hypothetical protein
VCVLLWFQALTSFAYSARIIRNRSSAC